MRDIIKKQVLNHFPRPLKLFQQSELRQDQLRESLIESLCERQNLTIFQRSQVSQGVFD